jgi:tetratricopeptide (TPR) repeat protein
MKSYFCRLLMIWLALGCFTSAVAGPYDDALKRGEQFEGKQKFREAVQAYDQAVEISPGAGAFLARGRAFCQLKKWDKAAADLNKAIDMGANGSAVYLLRAKAYYALKENEKAVDDYSKAIALKPSDPYPYCRRAEVLAQLDQFPKALEDLNNALKLDSSYAEAYSLRAKFDLTLEEFQRSIDDSTRALELDPKLTDALATRSQAYKELGKADLEAKHKRSTKPPNNSQD